MVFSSSFLFLFFGISSFSACSVRSFRFVFRGVLFLCVSFHEGVFLLPFRVQSSLGRSPIQGWDSVFLPVTVIGSPLPFSLCLGCVIDVCVLVPFVICLFAVLSVFALAACLHFLFLQYEEAGPPPVARKRTRAVSTRGQQRSGARTQPPRDRAKPARFACLPLDGGLFRELRHGRRPHPGLAPGQQGHGGRGCLAPPTFG